MKPRVNRNVNATQRRRIADNIPMTTESHEPVQDGDLGICARKVPRQLPTLALTGASEHKHKGHDLFRVRDLMRRSS